MWSEQCQGELQTEIIILEETEGRWCRKVSYLWVEGIYNDDGTAGGTLLRLSAQWAHLVWSSLVLPVNVWGFSWYSQLLQLSKDKNITLQRAAIGWMDGWIVSRWMLGPYCVEAVLKPLLTSCGRKKCWPLDAVVLLILKQPASICKLSSSSAAAGRSASPANRPLGPLLLPVLVLLINSKILQTSSYNSGPLTPVSLQ